TTIKATPSTATVIYNATTNTALSGNPALVPAGTSVYDTDTVTGGYNPGGTVTYNFYTTSSPVYGSTAPSTTQTVALNANGTVPNSATTAALAAGGYSYIAVYSGDRNFKGAVGPVEPLTINQGSLSMVTHVLYNGVDVTGTTIGE